MEIFPTYREVTDPFDGVKLDSSNSLITTKHTFSDPVLSHKDDSGKHEPLSINLSSSPRQSTPPLSLSRPFSSSELLSDFRSRASANEIVEDVARRLPKSENIAFEDDKHSNVTNNEERVFYRSWREGGHVLGPASGRLTSRRNSGDYEIDKKIEATLPSSEPTYHPRSRKASLYLRLFKDNDALKDNSPSGGKSGSLEPELNRSAILYGSRSESSTKNQYDTGRHFPSSISKDSKAREHDHMGKRCSEEGECVPNLQKDVTVVGHSAETSPASSVARPELRGKSFPTRNSSALPAGALVEHGTRNRISADDLHESKACSLHNDRDTGFQHTDNNVIAEGGDLEKEHISSALYFPHRSSSLIDEEESREVARPDRTSSPSLRSVEISLQAKDESQLLHGDIPSSQRLASLEHRLNAEPAFGKSCSNEKRESKLQADRSRHDGHSSLSIQRDYVPVDKKQSTLSSTTGLKNQVDDVPPLEAVELKPYDHQVGGHSTVYRFSRRAVCKQLNNRENEFYETIERNHVELLRFLPR